VWLPEPDAGTEVCGALDGSENDDFTVIKLETREGYLFTPRYGPDRRPTIWNPAEWGGRIPRGEVREAWEELASRFRLRRIYCDPGFHDETSWETEIEEWAAKYDSDDTAFVPWPTNQIGRMYPAIRRFESDLAGLITQDGCPITATHIRNARKIARGDKYILGKPSQHQKIDAAVTSVLAHEAASDERAAGWAEPALPALVFGL
jgi:phage terminase large subunit-like protein